MKKYSHKWSPKFANDVAALDPEMWAMEALLQLDNNLVSAKLVHTDFRNEIARAGSIVHAHRPSSFVAKRKNPTSSITKQDVTVEDIEVRLNQHWYTSFIIRDGEESVSFKSLIDMHIVPAAMSLAQQLDRSINQQVYMFMYRNAVGKLGTTPTSATITAARRKMINSGVPIDNNWHMLINAETEEAFLNIDKFVQANTLGDDGTALRNAVLGRKFGFNLITTQNVPTIESGVNDTIARAVNEAAGYAVGDTAITYDGSGGTIVAGSWCTIAGDDTPQKITADSGTVLTLYPGLRNAVVDNAVITIYEPALVNLVAGYAANWAEEIVIDDLTNPIQAGQLVSRGTAGTEPNYGSALLVGGESTTQVLLNQLIDATLANNATLGIGPAGGYNFAFHRNAIALVTRPLALPRPETGVRAFNATFGDISLRVTISYDPDAQGHVVTLDILGGIKVLDDRMGVAVFA